MRAGGSTLRLGVGRPVPRLPLELAIVTAYNPASLPAPRAANRAALRELAHRALPRAVRCLPARAHGTGADARRWDEPGIALVGEGALPAAVRLAVEAGQNAILAALPGGDTFLIVTRPGFCGHDPGDRLP